MNKQLMNLVIVAGLMAGLCAQPLQAEQSKALKYGTKTVKVAWRLGETVAAVVVAVVLISIKKKPEEEDENSVKMKGSKLYYLNSFLPASLLINGLNGLNKELEIAKHAKKLLQKMKHKDIKKLLHKMKHKDSKVKAYVYCRLCV